MWLLLTLLHISLTVTFSQPHPRFTGDDNGLCCFSDIPQSVHTAGIDVRRSHPLMRITDATYNYLTSHSVYTEFVRRQA